MSQNSVQCVKCNTETFVGARFCMRCGSAIPKSSAPTTEALELNLDDIDKSFDFLMEEAKPDSTAAQAPPDSSANSSIASDAAMGEAAQLFKQIAAEHVTPLREFLLELELGEPRREWIGICRGAIGTLRKCAAELDGEADLTSALDRVETELGRVNGAANLTASALDPVALKSAYTDLRRLLPAGPELDTERSRREPLILDNLLHQVQELSEPAIDRLYAAGLTKLRMLRGSQPDEVADATGLSLEQARAVVQAVELYFHETAQLVPDESHGAERALLQQLVGALKRQNSDLEAAARRWSPQARRQKRALYKTRSETLLKVKLLLARMGQVELVDELEPLPFADKVTKMDGFLGLAAARTQSSPE